MIPLGVRTSIDGSRCTHVAQLHVRVTCESPSAVNVEPTHWYGPVDSGAPISIARKWVTGKRSRQVNAAVPPPGWKPAPAPRTK